MPNRVIKENIRTSKKLNSISDFAFRVWAYLLTFVDDYGCSSADVDIIKGFCFSKMRDKTNKYIADSLSELASIGLIQLYEVDGDPYLHIVDWEKYQTLRAKKRKCPPPPSGCKQMQADASRCMQMQTNADPIQSNPIQSESEYESENESESVVEVEPTADEDKLSIIDKKYGVVLLSENQMNDLLDRLTLDEFDEYVERLGAFIVEKNAHIKSHYQTILKWVEQDRKRGKQ